MNEPSITDATESDVAIIVSLIHRAFEEYRGVLDPPSGAHSETEETVRTKMTKARVGLARLDNTAIGCVFYEREAEWMYLSRLAVLPIYRRRGIGHALIEYVEARMREAGLTRVRLGERLALPHLRAMYEQQGYKIVELGTHPGYAAPTFAIMEKSICS